LKNQLQHCHVEKTVIYASSALEPQPARLRLHDDSPLTLWRHDRSAADRWASFAEEAGYSQLSVQWKKTSRRDHLIKRRRRRFIVRPQS
jgi:hypothetical protein